MRVRGKSTLLAAALALGAAATVPFTTALEISLEENKAERGNIGYVDIQKIFRLYPGTYKAKQSYAEIVRQAEEQVNLKRAELMTLHAEITKLQFEYDLLVKAPLPTPPPSPPATSPPPAAPTPAPPAVSTAAAANAALDEVLGSTTPAALPVLSPEEQKNLKNAASSSEVALPELPGMGKRLTVEDNAKKTDEEPLIINIPGMTDKPIIVQPPAPEEIPAIKEKPAPEAAPADQAPPAAPPVAATPPQVRSSSAAIAMVALIRRQRLEELAAEIAAKKRTLSQKEKAFGEYQSQVEKNLIDIESRRSEILLGRIYRVVRAVARENGVSVVVDKREILFGQDTVDLTAKVIKKLEGFPL